MLELCRCPNIYGPDCICGNTAYRAIEPLKVTAREIPSPQQPYSYVYFPNITSGYDAEHVHSTSLVYIYIYIYIYIYNLYVCVTM